MEPDYKKYPVDCPHCGARRGYPCDPEIAATSLEDAELDWEKSNRNDAEVAKP